MKATQYNGKPCRRCGGTLRRKTNGGCVPCHNAAVSARQRTPAVKQRHQELHLQRTFGLSLTDYDVLVTAQGGGCAICFGPPDYFGRFHVDHDHATGEIRGLLCQRCNRGLGHFRDNPDLLIEAAEYITCRN